MNAKVEREKKKKQIHTLVFNLPHKKDDICKCTAS
jgi:hypothetical protein